MSSEDFYYYFYYNRFICANRATVQNDRKSKLGCILI